VLSFNPLLHAIVPTRKGSIMATPPKETTLTLNLKNGIPTPPASSDSILGPASAAPQADNGFTLAIPDVTLSPPSTSNLSPKPSQCVVNPEGPDHHFQVFQKSLLEYEFDHHEAFVSARIQRIQHGVYTDPDRLLFYGTPNSEMIVTFVAVTFIFHPINSLKHRFQRATIEITAQDNDHQPLKFVKFAPHLAFGRVSTETLHWTFALSATIGVTQAPVSASVTPSTSFDTQKVIDAMLKIQGSTRTHRGVESGKLVWSLEENQQQGTGLPREFTFVFLLERRDPRNGLHLAVSIKPVLTLALGPKFLEHDVVGGNWVNVGKAEMGQRFSRKPFNFATMAGQFEDLIELPGNAIRIAVSTVSVYHSIGH
jgi:hypothetical protein